MKLAPPIRRSNYSATLLALFAVIPLAVAQNATPGASATTAVKPIPFEVVSIRPSIPTRVHGDAFTEDGYTIHGITPLTLLTYMSKTLSGVPDWCSNERYDIVAKVAEADVPAWKNMNFKQKSLAMRPMLEDRFKLKWHIETKMEPGYELVIAKNGSKLKEPTPAEIDLRAKDPTPGHAVLLSGGGRGVGLAGFVVTAASMDLLTYYLQMFARAPVVNKTGLSGTYDFTFTAAPQPDPNAGLRPANQHRPSLFPAVQQQLGLKLAPAKVPVETLVVDHIERPSAN